MVTSERPTSDTIHLC